MGAKKFDPDMIYNIFIPSQLGSQLAQIFHPRREQSSIAILIKCGYRDLSF